MKRSSQEYIQLEETLDKHTRNLEECRETLSADKVKLNQQEGDIKVLEEQINAVRQSELYYREQIENYRAKVSELESEQEEHRAKTKEFEDKLQQMEHIGSNSVKQIGDMPRARLFPVRFSYPSGYDFVTPSSSAIFSAVEILRQNGRTVVLRIFRAVRVEDLPGRAVVIVKAIPGVQGTVQIVIFRTERIGRRDAKRAVCVIVPAEQPQLRKRNGNLDRPRIFVLCILDKDFRLINLHQVFGHITDGHDGLFTVITDIDERAELTGRGRLQIRVPNTDVGRLGLRKRNIPRAPDYTSHRYKGTRCRNTPDNHIQSLLSASSKRSATGRRFRRLP